MRDNKKGQFPTDRRNDRGGKDGKAAGGSRDTLSSAFIRALHADWSEHGPSVIEQIRKEQPGAYIKTVACLLSKQADVSQDALDTLTDEELDELDRLSETRSRSPSSGGRRRTRFRCTLSFALFRSQPTQRNG